MNVAAFAILLAGTAQEPRPWEGYNKGIRWEASLAAALRRASAEGKPVLFHQLVGDLDKEGC